MKRATRERMEADIRAGVRTGGYPKKLPDGRWELTDWHGKRIGVGFGTCTRIRPGAPGSWFSSERCTYHFKIGDSFYSCRGYGQIMHASCRRMKKPPRYAVRADFSGVHRRRRKR